MQKTDQTETIKIADIRAISQVLGQQEITNLTRVRREMMMTELEDTARSQLEKSVEDPEWKQPHGIFSTAEEYVDGFMDQNFANYLKKTPIRLLKKKNMIVPFWDDDETMLYVLSTKGVNTIDSPVIYDISLKESKYPTEHENLEFAIGHKSEVLRVHWNRLGKTQILTPHHRRMYKGKKESIAEYETRMYPGPKSAKQLKKYIKTLNEIMARRTSTASRKGINQVTDFYSHPESIVDYKAEDAGHTFPLLMMRSHHKL